MKKDTKEAIIKSAAELFYKKGFEETTFADIAKACKITQPACYSYFKNKMDLLNHICLWSAENGRSFIDKNINSNDPAMQRLQSYIFANVDFFRTHKIHAHSIMALYFFSFSNHEMFESFKIIQDIGVKRIETFLVHGQYEQTWKLKDLSAAAQAINSFLIGECYKAIYFVKKDTIEDFKKGTWQIILLLIQGC